MKTIICLLFAILPFIYARTLRTVLKTCDGVERRIIGERLIGESIRGRIMCRYQPKDTSYTFAIRINSLDLKNMGSICPTVQLIGYTSKRRMEELDVDDRIDLGRAIYVPADPEKLAVFDCKNYTKVIGKVIVGKTLGQKVQLEYDTKGTTEPRKQPFDITISSFQNGVSYQCPAKHFRCWSDRYMCIDNSLECDTERNCADNSDEDNYKCTGRIAGLPLGMFVVIIILAFMLLIGAIIGVIFYRRKQTMKKNKSRQEREAALNMEPHAGYPFIGDPTAPREYSAYHPES